MTIDEVLATLRANYQSAMTNQQEDDTDHLAKYGEHFDKVIAEIEAAAEQRGAEASLLWVDEPSWEHHDQTDGFPCTNCLNKAQKNIDRYRADRIANKEGDIA